MKFRDSDTGESETNFVKVPEGFSIQMGMTGNREMPKDYISCILSKEDTYNLVDFLMEQLMNQNND